MDFTPEMKRWAARKKHGMRVPGNPAKAYNALAAIRDAAIAASLMTAYTSKMLDIDTPNGQRRAFLENVYRCIHGLSDTVDLSKDTGPNYYERNRR